MGTETVELEEKDAAGKGVGKKAVPANVFGIDREDGLFHQVVRWQRAKKRAGTHAVKTRSEVAGGGTKPWRQKGTGRARAGSNSSPVWIGGGVAHGPKPRSYEFKLNRKQRKKALCSALSQRREAGALIVVDDFGLSEIKTKAAHEVLSAIGVEKYSKAVVVTEDEKVSLSLRNIDGVSVLESEGLNVYDVLNSEYIVVVGKSLDSILERLG